MPNMSSNDDRMVIRRKWDMLMPRECPRASLAGASYHDTACSLAHLLVHSLTVSSLLVGSGSVAIPDYRDHPLLGEPISDDPIRSGPLFEASWTHALHCVSKVLGS
jgi:hypothetical protein